MTKRQERFVLEFIKDANGTQAAIRAGFSKKAAAQIATRLLRDVHIDKAIADARGPARESAQITLVGHLNELARLRDRADQAEQFSAATSAEMARGKVAGLYVERSLVETRQLPQLVVE